MFTGQNLAAEDCLRLNMSTKGPSIAPRSQALAASPPANSPPVSAKPIMTKRPSISSAPSPAKTSSATSSTNLAPSPNASGFPQIITSKEWVLPPRPKPGRKPSVDTPASKRKAQNRAAQRAFRERRATRVQELEEKLMEVEKDKELRELNLHNTINKLKVENQFLMKSMDQMLKKENEEFNESSPVENCGFCSDDTPCVCREAAKEAARLNESLNTDSQHQSHHQHEQHQDEDEETSLPPIQLNNNSFRKTSLPVMHPGPSVEIREITNLTPGAVPTVVRRNTDGTTIPEDEENNDKEKETTGCTGNPGACLQCQTDPMSTLFCATVANKVKESENNPDSNDQAEAAEAAEAADSPASLSAASPARDFFNFNAKSNSTPPAISRSGSKTNIPSLAMTSLTNPSTPIATTPGGTVTSSVDFSTLVGKLTTRGMQVEH
ncbi:hypothetical protein QCA50_018827 [Cerrena zonata]|uniref:BZIP domain-containing protein n=1 Tax=Cerrena zonata TaxID=2478898 RepID=A0AAW0FGV5_9APHY